MNMLYSISFGPKSFFRIQPYRDPVCSNQTLRTPKSHATSYNGNPRERILLSERQRGLMFARVGVIDRAVAGRDGV